MACAQRCWACGVANAPPDGFDLFKCGWCGALTSRTAAAEPTPDPGAPQLQLSAAPRPGRPAPAPYLAGCILVVLIVAVVGSIFVLGLSLVLPALVGPAALACLHGPAAVLLACGVLYNYAACVVRAPGPVAPHLHRTALDASGRVRRGALDACRYCERCCWYKPAGAHHCGSCGVCVLGMDHHCWYVNNCVGAANLRHFILLLLYVVLSTAYGLAAGLAMGWADRSALLRHTWGVLAATKRFHPALRVPALSMHWVLAAPPWMAMWAYFCGVCWAALVAVGVLLRRQVLLLLRGQTYLDSLHAAGQKGGGAVDMQQYWAGVAPSAQALLPPAAAHAEAAAGDGAAEAGPAVAGAAASAAAASTAQGSAGMRNARRVFGAGHPLTWLLPAWVVAPAPDGSGNRRQKVQ